jgi:hypothetical protein
MKSIVHNFQDEDGDERDVKRLARRLLNESTKNRVVSKQEALCQLSGLKLYSCSEFFEYVSLSGNTNLGGDQSGKTTFLSKYAKRPQELHHLSLNQYFHFLRNPEHSSSKKIFKIPIYSGAKCEAVYPATNEYARGVMMIHCPWNKKFDLTKDDPLLLQRFQSFIDDRSLCPKSVFIAFEYARLQSQKKEQAAPTEEEDYNNFTLRPDKETGDLVDLASTIFDAYADESELTDYNYDYGKDFDWSTPSVEVSLPNILINVIAYTSVLENKHGQPARP